MQGDEYPGSGRDQAIIHISCSSFCGFTTGDKITPREIEYSFNYYLMTDDLKSWRTNLETVLAEKLETVITRGIA